METALSDAIGDDINSIETPRARAIAPDRVRPFSIGVDGLKEESKSERNIDNQKKRYSSSTASN